MTEYRDVGDASEVGEINADEFMEDVATAADVTEVVPSLCEAPAPMGKLGCWGVDCE
jgi:hypothetical protein